MLIQAILEKNPKLVSDILCSSKYKNFLNWIYHEEEIIGNTPKNREIPKNTINWIYHKNKIICKTSNSIATGKNALDKLDKTLYPFTPLILAIKLNQLDIVKVLIAHGADVNLSPHNSNPLFPIDYALLDKEKPNVALIQVLLFNNANFSHLIGNPMLENMIVQWESFIQIPKPDFFSQLKKMRDLVENYRSLEEDKRPVYFHIKRKESSLCI